MRVLAVMASGATGGGASHLRLVLPALAARGIEVEALVGGDGPLVHELRALGVPTSTIDLMGSRVDPRSPPRLAAAIRRARADLVHHHGTRAAFFGALARPLAPTPIVYTAHGLALSQRSGRAAHLAHVGAERLACAAAAHVVTVSAADREDLERRLLVRPGGVTHLENPVDPRHFAPGDRAALRERLGLPAEPFVAVTVSRLVPQKAVADLVRAAGLCRERVRLAVIGGGPQAEELRSLAAGLPVHLLGERRDVAELWAAFDAFALSSRWEGEPTALVEAMAAGLPCVATETPGAVGLLASGPGRLVPLASPAALASALDELARLAPEARRSLGASGRALVQHRTPALVAERLAAIYDRALAESR